MKITDSAKDVLQQALNETGAHGLRVAIQETCCGKSPVIGLDVYTEDDQPETVNDINIVIPEEARDVVDGLEIDLIVALLLVDIGQDPQGNLGLSSSLRADDPCVNSFGCDEGAADDSSPALTT